MNTIRLSQIVFAAAIACASTATFAQDAMKSSPMGKKDMTMQDCKDRTTTAKGEKRNDTPPNADIDKTCADMMKNGDGKMMKKDHSMKKEKGTTQEQPAK